MKKKAPSFEEIQERFKQYLLEIDLEKELEIIPNLLSFHWRNWDLTCRLVQDGPLSIFTKENLLEGINNKIEGLRSHKVWLNNTIDTIEATEFDLYQFYLDARVRESWFKSDRNILLSDNSRKGPFTRLTSMQWKDKTTYSYFVMKKIIEGKYSLRKFRLSSDVEFDFSFREFPYHEAKGSIKQFNLFGVLVRYEGLPNHYKFQESDRIHFSFDSKLINKVFKLSKRTTKLQDERMKISLDASPLKQNLCSEVGPLEGKSYYLFIPYSNFEFDPMGRLFVQNLNMILEDVHNNFEDVFQSELPTFHSWVKKVS
ncbi:MAG: hypothetical protein ACPGJV_00905 [Bacteriovoracaceae bacterium]